MLATKMTEKELIQEYKENRSREAFEELLSRFESHLKYLVRDFYAKGYSQEDFKQEARIGFLEAIESYDPNHEDGKKFINYALFIAKRKIITCIIASKRKKYINMNTISLDCVIDESGRTNHDAIPAPPELGDPLWPLLERDEQEEIQNIFKHFKMQKLSKLESKVLNGMLQRKSYQQMADEQQISTKSVDNAVQRVKLKLKEFMS
ncbi:sigma-70 family RNA polymerase sigma factor [Brevibacillus agri]|uniref:sigma-70 family RNA polymerase sigma factor n=1 Tax=Brevibacillus agri TaxID=51101 RepID=UPI0025B6F0C7|nr:sigma-70 family RNA polymerase sigma factor [Brevibacillus agri]MDN4094365.1 sigma-70 family RNA polymerase sigma factor [Brevibacillus agri]